MTKQELEALINQGEGFHIEFKESVNANLAKEMAAFSNAKGGRVLIGVNDDGIINTQPLNNSTRSKIQDLARDSDPSISISLELVDGLDSVIVVNIVEGKSKPYRCSGGFYMREGASSNKRNTQEIYDMYKSSGRFSFDDLLHPDVIFEEHFSPSLLDGFLQSSGKEKLLSNEATLCNFDLAKMVEGKCILTNAGILFFTEEPSRFIKQSVIQCIRFEGEDRVNIIDQQHLGKDVFSNITDCFSFLKKHLNVGYEFSDSKLERKEKWEIPLVVLREAVVNAVIHRDYLDKGTYIQVLIFDSSVSIINFGGLIDGMTINDLGRRTYRRNPNIADILGKTNLSEKMGSGIHRIRKNLIDSGLPEAIFEVDENWFSVTFHRPNDNKIYKLEEVDFELTKLQYEVLEFCNEPRSRNEIFEKVGLSNQSINYTRHIVPLIDNGLLQMSNPDNPRNQNQKYHRSN